MGLLALLVVPLAAAAYWFVDRRPSRYALAFPNLEVLAGVADEGRWRRRIPAALFLLALVAALLAIARPQVNTLVDREQATVVLAVDTSGSMVAEDVRPTRLRAAQRAVGTFLDKLPPKFRVGMAFAAEAEVVAPVTTNRAPVRDAVQFLSPLRGTAIGDAVARAAELAQEATGVPPDVEISGFDFGLASSHTDDGSGPPAAVLLQTAGTRAPLEGAARAEGLGIPVYTIALGTDQGVIDLSFGGAARRDPRAARPADAEADRRADGRQFSTRRPRRRSRPATRSWARFSPWSPGKDEAAYAFVAAAAALVKPDP